MSKIFPGFVLTALFVVFVYLCWFSFKLLSGFWLVFMIFALIMGGLSLLGSILGAVFGAKF